MLLLLSPTVAVADNLGDESLAQVAQFYDANPSEAMTSFSGFVDGFRLGYLSMYRTQKMVAHKSGISVEFGGADDKFMKCVLGNDPYTAIFSRLLGEAKDSPDKMLFIWIASDFNDQCGREMRAAISDQYRVMPLSAATRNLKSGLERWPPVAQELREQFRKNREGLEALGRSLGESPYNSVFQPGDGSVAGFEEGDDASEVIELESEKVWNALFAAAGVTSVTRYRGSTEFSNHYEAADIADGRVFGSAYVKSNTAESSSCLPHFAETECGVCVERLDDNWHMTLMWYPADWLKGFEDLEDSELTGFNELNAQMQVKMNSCLGTFQK